EEIARKAKEAAERAAQRQHRGSVIVAPAIPTENLDVSLRGVKNRFDTELADYTIDPTTSKITFVKKIPALKENAKKILKELGGYITKHQQKIKTAPPTQDAVAIMLERLAHIDPLLISTIAVDLKNI